MEHLIRAKTVFFIGSLLTAAAAAWWLILYGTLLNQLAGAMPAFGPGAPLHQSRPSSDDLGIVLVCFVLETTFCRNVEGVALMAGFPAYPPVIAWIGLSLLAIGWFMRMAATPDQPRSYHAPSPEPAPASDLWAWAITEEPK